MRVYPVLNFDIVGVIAAASSMRFFSKLVYQEIENIIQEQNVHTKIIQRLAKNGKRLLNFNYA
jgi:hypothetical protein